jgi:hypothetical protein
MNGRAKMTASQRNVQCNLPGLSDAQRAAVALVFDCRVPPSTQMEDVISAGQGQPNTTGTWRKDHRVESVRRCLEAIHAGLPARTGHSAIDHHWSGGEAVAALDQPGEARMYPQIVDK